MHRIQAVIFDWAGTTVDFGCFAPVAAFVEVFARRGITVTVQEARAPMGLAKKDHVRTMCEMERIAGLWQDRFGCTPTEQDVEAMYGDFETLLMRELPRHTQVIPGVVQLVARLRKRGLRIGSTTGYTAEMMQVLAPAARQQGYEPDSLVTPSEVPTGRPNPWMIYLNAMRLGVYPMQSVVKVGDTISDIQEGLNAGAWTVGVVLGSSELGLSEAEVLAMDLTLLADRITEVELRMRAAGAHEVIRSIDLLEGALDRLETRMRGDNPYLLLTPGPVSTTRTVREAMLRDWCTWDQEYNDIVQSIRHRLTNLAAKDSSHLTTVLIQGSGTFCVESVLGTSVPRHGKLLVLANGAYGNRIGAIARRLGIDHTILDYGEVTAVDAASLAEALTSDETITHVALVHCETTTGMLNPINQICSVVKAHNKLLIVDAMSSFGGVELDMRELGIDFLISSANKCIQGVPGFGFVIARRSVLEQCRGQARSLALDLFDQWETMERHAGKWRFTSPTHAVRAFDQALSELDSEGGISARSARYQHNQALLAGGMEGLGFRCLLPAELQSPIITAFRDPVSPAYRFNEWYQRLKEKGFVIYPGKVTSSATFRIGNIGDIHGQDVDRFLRAVESSIWR